MIDPTNMTFEQRLDYLSKLAPREWDAICRSCGMCCLIKVGIGFGSRRMIYSKIACDKLDLKTKKCTCYARRLEKKECHKLDLKSLQEGKVVPASCAYSEFLYGPAKYPADIDFGTVLPERKMGQLSIIEFARCFLRRSIKWNKR